MSLDILGCVHCVALESVYTFETRRLGSWNAVFLAHLLNKAATVDLPSMLKLKWQQPPTQLFYQAKNIIGQTLTLQFSKGSWKARNRGNTMRSSFSPTYTLPRTNSPSKLEEGDRAIEHIKWNSERLQRIRRLMIECNWQIERFSSSRNGELLHIEGASYGSISASSIEGSSPF